MKKQLQSDEIAKMIQRQNVITFKRKTDGKASVKSQKQQDDDISSAKSNPIEQSNFSKPSKKSIPLPELSKQRKRLILRNILPETKSQSNSNYLQKQVRQHDNLMLKNSNNSLTSENIKLKTKNMNLEKEIGRLLKIIEEDPQKQKVLASKEVKIRPNQSLSLRIALKNVQKQLDEVKKQNSKIKASIKFTTISEMQAERDNILQECKRLREMLQEERNKLLFLKANQQGISTMEHKLMQLQERNNFLTRENNELKGKVGKVDEKQRSYSKLSDNEKNLNKVLFNTRRLLKQKEKQVESLKAELKKQPIKIQSTKLMEMTSETDNSRQKQVKSELNSKAERPDRLKNIKEKRLMSKSAQKYRSSVQNGEKVDGCEKCRELKDENIVLKKQIQQLKADLEQSKLEKSPMGELSKNPIVIPSKQELSTLQRFLVHRFKAHHLTLDEASYHLVNFEGKPQDLDKQISVGQILEIAMAQPFSILSDRYIESFIIFICYNESIASPPENGKCAVADNKKLTRKIIRDNFKSLVGTYQLINQNRQEQMFIQIAELVTQYQQHILKALNEKRNSESTISEKDFYEFFKEIELEQEYIEFMVCQIILESLDLDHLNIYNLFEIFYMPPQEQLPVSIDPMKMYGVQPPQKKKFNVIDSVVKEEDQEYEESKSFMDSRKKTLSKHDQENEPHQIQEMEQGQQQAEAKLPVAQVSDVKQQYEQKFQEQKMENPAQEEKNNEEGEKEVVPQHYNIQQLEQQYADDYES